MLISPVLINRPSSLMEMHVQFIVEQERNTPPQDVIVSNGQAR